MERAKKGEPKAVKYFAKMDAKIWTYVELHALNSYLKTKDSPQKWRGTYFYGDYELRTNGDGQSWLCLSSRKICNITPWVTGESQIPEGGV